jgi:hypothetical protein
MVKIEAYPAPAYVLSQSGIEKVFIGILMGIIT